MRNRLALLRLLGTLGAAGGVALAGCAGVSTTASTAHAAKAGANPRAAMLRHAAARTTASSGARVSGQATLAGATGATQGALHVTDSGVVNFAKHAAAMTVAVPGGQTVQVRLIGPTVYVHETGQSGWSRVSQASQAHSVATTILTPGDPATLMDYLHYPATSVTRVGTQAIGGVPTTEYAATLHPSTETSKLGMPVHVWIDRQDRIRRAVITVQTQVTASPSASSPRTVDNMDLTVNFSHFGIRPVITAPGR